MPSPRVLHAYGTTTEFYTLGVYSCYCSTVDGLLHLHVMLLECLPAEQVNYARFIVSAMKFEQDHPTKGNAYDVPTTCLMLALFLCLVSLDYSNSTNAWYFFLVNLFFSLRNA